jgi:hypothetical protein
LTSAGLIVVSVMLVMFPFLCLVRVADVAVSAGARP